ncbi:MAG TPA: ABC transporter substrate-binding protein [Stellaceae bacterium]|nr:ABC transporter substrate-binding protein [Stellaceae bacterium]
MREHHCLAAVLAGAAAGLCFTLALAATNCASAQSAVKADTAGSPTWFGALPIMVAVDKGYFKEQGLDVEYKVILNSSDRVRAVTSGDVVWSNLGRVAVIAEMARGNTSFYYFANVDDSPGNEGCWARPGFASFQDLKGKKIAANASAEVTLNGLLQLAGMTVKDIQYLNLAPNEMAGALAKGDIDAACVWQPLFEGVKAAAPGGKLLGLDSDTAIGKQFGTMAAPDIVIISKKFVDQNPAAAGKLAAALLKGADYVNSNLDDAAATVAHYFKKEPAEVAAGAKSFKYFGARDWQAHMKLHTQQMQVLADWMYENKKIDVKLDVTKWESTSFIPK